MNEDINAIKNELNNFKMTGDKMDMLNKKVVSYLIILIHLIKRKI